MGKSAKTDANTHTPPHKHTHTHTTTPPQLNSVRDDSVLIKTAMRKKTRIVESAQRKPNDVKACYARNTDKQQKKETS